MSMEIKLTDIRGEPPLKVGEFILDKDNNVLYVGSGDFELTKNGGAEIGVIAKFSFIPPKKAYIVIKDNGNIKINAIGKFTLLSLISVNINIKDNSDTDIKVNGKFTKLDTFKANINLQDISNINMKGSGKIVT